MAFREVTLQPEQVMFLFQSLLRVNTSGDRKLGRYADKAEARLGQLVNFKQQLDGSFEFAKPKADITFALSNDELLGIKTAMSQDINGVPNSRLGAPHGQLKYTLLPLARALGIEKMLTKECGLDVEAKDPAELTFDDAPETGDPEVDAK